MLGLEELELEDGDGMDGELCALELDDEGIEGMLELELELVDWQAPKAILIALASIRLQNFLLPFRVVDDMTGCIVDSKCSKHTVQSLLLAAIADFLPHFQRSSTLCCMACRPLPVPT